MIWLTLILFNILKILDMEEASSDSFKGSTGLVRQLKMKVVNDVAMWSILKKFSGETSYIFWWKCLLYPEFFNFLIFFLFLAYKVNQENYEMEIIK